ncbi:recombinase family protein [Evansella halocellulosilytica]|uniref:recombinase family protein n=1 Tax=Evansella halocellulosilytica TaxID=2011013 RepID=UPI000BB7C48C|nr:recombinase family protein [Evansella halocellulosilytica]
MENSNKAVAYIRVSRMGLEKEDWDEKESPKTQLDTIQKYCDLKGYELVRVYQDLDKSGKDDERDEFKKMIKAIENGEDIGVVVVYNLTRFSRSLLDINKYLELFDEHHVNFASATEEHLRTDNSMGRLMVNIMGAIAQFERERIAENVRNNMRNRARRGLHNGGFAPVGYYVNDKGTYSIKEDEAKVVKRIFQMYVDGYGKGRISEVLSSEKVLGREWPKSTIHEILINEKYKGEYIFGKRDKRKGKPRYKDRSEWIIPEEDYKHPAIVSEVLFEKAQKVREQRGDGKNYFKKENVQTYVLGGMIYCGQCGSKMTGRTNRNSKGKKYRYYTCSKKDKQFAGACSQRSIRQEKIDALVIDSLEGYISHESFLENMKKAHREYIEDLKIEYSKILKLESEIRVKTELKKQYASMIVDARTEGEDEDVIKDMKEKLKEVKEEIETLEIQKKKLYEFKEEDSEITLDIIEELEKMDPCELLTSLDNLKENFNIQWVKHFDEESQNRLLKNYTKRVEVADLNSKKTEVKITFNFSKDNVELILFQNEKIKNPVFYDDEYGGYESFFKKRIVSVTNGTIHRYHLNDKKVNISVLTDDFHPNK